MKCSNETCEKQASMSVVEGVRDRAEHWPREDPSVSVPEEAERELRVVFILLFWL